MQVQANTWYVVSYSDPNGHFSLDYNALTGADVDQGLLHAQGGSNNGRWVAGAGNFPANSGGGDNYWVDLYRGIAAAFGTTTPARGGS